MQRLVVCLRRLYTDPVIDESRQGASGVGEVSEGDLVLRFGDIFQVIWRRLWVVALAILVCVGAAVGIGLQQDPLYQASIKVLVGQDQGVVSDPTQAANLQNLALTFSEAVATRPVGERVVRNLDLQASPEDIVDGTTAEVIADTQFIEVTYTDSDPRMAQRIVNAIGEAFSEQVSEVSPGASGVDAIVWEPAELPQSPVSPNILLNALIAFVVGSMLGVGLALLLDHLDDSWKSSAEAEQVSGVPTLGVIPRLENLKGN